MGKTYSMVEEETTTVETMMTTLTTLTVEMAREMMATSSGQS